MIRSTLSILLLLALSSSLAWSGEDEKRALILYLTGDSSNRKSLLAPDFQYLYIGDKKVTFSRDHDLKAMDRLAEDTVDHSYVAKIDQIIEYSHHPDQFRVIFDIPFHDSPKIWPGSFFRGADLEVDQLFIVKLEQGKIVRIEEKREKKNNKLLLGKLKTIYLKNQMTEAGEDDVFKLFDSDNHELLFWKKLRRGTATDYFYFWPNNHLIKNFFYPPVE